MKRAILCVALAAVFVMPANAALQQPSSKTFDSDLTSRLREDLSTALANANLTDEQTTTLGAARETLREASEARKAGRPLDRDAVKAALAELKRLLDSEAFRPGDAKRVKDDIEAIQKAMKDQIKRELRQRRRRA